MGYQTLAFDTTNLSKLLMIQVHSVFSLQRPQWRDNGGQNGGPKISKESFRPISLLATLSKVCESIIHERLLNHFTEHNIISDKQAAYLKGDSTINQLLYLTHSIRRLGEPN